MTELSIPVGAEQPIMAPYVGARRRFPSQKCAFYLKPDAGDGSGAYLLWA